MRKHLITAWILTALLAAAGGCASAAPAPLTGSAMQGVWSGTAYKHHNSVPVPYTLRITQASGDSFRGTATNPAARFTIEGTVRGNVATVDFGRGVTWQGTVIGNVWKGKPWSVELGNAWSGGMANGRKRRVEAAICQTTLYT